MSVFQCGVRRIGASESLLTYDAIAGRAYSLAALRPVDDRFQRVEQLPLLERLDHAAAGVQPGLAGLDERVAGVPAELLREDQRDRAAPSAPAASSGRSRSCRAA